MQSNIMILFTWIFNEVKYHAYTALTCLYEIFAKAVHERQVYEDGGMITAMPTRDENIDEEQKSAALDQAESIQQYRYNPSTANSGHTATSGLLPPPSFSGLAFALVAAVMPLLVSSDCKLATLAARVFHITMPHVLEGNNASRTQQLSNENCGRLRHLLSRFEQLLANVQFNELFATFWSLLRTNINEQYTPSSTQRVAMVEELSTTSIVFFLVYFFLGCIGCLHPNWLQRYNST
jgi:hypothetical protein